MARLVPKIYPADYDENIPIGIGFPLTVDQDPKVNYETTKQVHDNLRNLILTIPGERPMEPDFGCNLLYLVFDQMNEQQMTDAATAAIKTAVSTWMPAVTIMDVDLATDMDNYTMMFTVAYSVDGWAAENVLNLTMAI